MQLQLECNRTLGKQKSCLICETLFEMQEARVILCNDQGRHLGDVCPECLGKGLNWLNQRFNRLEYYQQVVYLPTSQPTTEKSSSDVISVID